MYDADLLEPSKGDSSTNSPDVSVGVAAFWWSTGNGPKQLADAARGLPKRLGLNQVPVDRFTMLRFAVPDAGATVATAAEATAQRP